jgi:hypothetical protein
MPLSKIVAKSITDDTITTDQIADTSVHGARNRLINGEFQIWQRGTSSTSGGYQTADRWAAAFHNGAATMSQQSFALGQTDVPGEPKFYFRHNVTTQSTNYMPNIQQNIEGVRSLAGQTVTLSLYAKASKALELKTYIFQHFGSGGSPSSGVVVENSTKIADLTTSWQRITYTFDVDSINGKTLGTNGDDSLQVYLQMPLSDTYSVDFALIQLEVGSATPFEHRSYGEELSLCQRYYVEFRNSRFIGGYKRHDVQTSFKVHFPVSMRATPTVTLDDGGSFTNFQSVLSGTQSSPVVFEADAQFNEIVLAVNSTYSGTHTFIPSWESQEVTFDAEL